MPANEVLRKDRTAQSRVLGLGCMAVLCTILALGLWPFHVPRNEVDWLRDRPGLWLGRHSTVIGSAALRLPGGGKGSGGSVEMWLQPARTWDSGAVLAFHAPGNPSQLVLRQSLSDLEIQAGAPRLYAGNVFRAGRPVFVTVTAGERGTAVYVDGTGARTAPRFRLSPETFTGRLVVGDAPGQTDSWNGQVFGLAIYQSELDPAQVRSHFLAWTQKGRPEIAESERSVALYLMDERAGKNVHDKSGSGPELWIPERYTVLDQVLLEPFWREFSFSRSYFGAAMKNVVGFVPFGFAFCAWLTARRFRRPELAAVVLGAATSLTIEVLQAYLPTRDSGTTDIITNTLGTWVGVAGYRLLYPLAFGRFPCSPVVFSRLAIKDGD
jgi:hypothetical protein